jgi:hypothetical protein
VIEMEGRRHGFIVDGRMEGVSLTEPLRRR